MNIKPTGVRFPEIIKTIAAKHGLELSEENLAKGGERSITVRVKGDSYMPLHIGIYGKNTVAVSHTFVQNGDLMRDPEITFYVIGGKWYPMDYTQHSLGIYHEYFFVRADNAIVSRVALQRWQRSAAMFANTWGANLKAQGFLGENSYKENTD